MAGHVVALMCFMGNLLNGHSLWIIPPYNLHREKGLYESLDNESDLCQRGVTEIAALDVLRFLTTYPVTLERSSLCPSHFVEQRLRAWLTI